MAQNLVISFMTIHRSMQKTLKEKKEKGKKPEILF